MLIVGATATLAHQEAAQAGSASERQQSVRRESLGPAAIMIGLAPRSPHNPSGGETMKTIVFLLMLTAAIATIAASWQGPECGSSERRAKAVGYARQINNAEARAFRESGGYAALSALPIDPVPDTFAVQVSTDGRTYTFSVKDTSNGCHAATFSDQQGVIYNAAPIQ